MDQTPENRNDHRRGRRVSLVGCGVIAVVSVFCCVAYIKSALRYTVIGPTDPATGIRIQYTVSSSYIRKRDDADKPQRRNRDAFQDWQYTPASPSPLLRWLSAHLPKGRATALELEDSGPITQTSSKHAKMGGGYVNPRGYVSVDLKRARAAGTFIIAGVASQEYKMVGDCPTTLVVEDGDIVANGHAMQYYDLLVRPKGQSIIYIFQATGWEGTSPNPALRELKAIRESIRVVKAK